MSQENIEVVRGAIDDWNRRDWRSWVAKHHWDMVAVPHEDWPEPEPLVGCEAWLRQVRGMLEPWAEQHLEIDDVEAVGDVVIFNLRWVAKGRASDIDVDIPIVGNYTITDGKIKHIDFFFEVSEAREAAGVASRPPSRAEREQSRNRANELWSSFEIEMGAADALRE